MLPTRSMMDSENNLAPRDMLVNPIAALDEEMFALADVSETREVAASVDASEWLCVRVGPIGLLLSATSARELVDPPPSARLPHSPAWIAGMANVRGALVLVVDTALLLEVKHNLEARNYLLIFNQGDDALGLIVDGLPRPLSFQASERLHALPPHPPLLDGHLTGAYDRSGQLWFEVNLDSFFRALAQRIGQA